MPSPYFDWLDRAAKRPSEVTWPLYRREGPRRYSFVGSSVLLEILGRHFVLTAAHVFSQRAMYPIYLATPNGIRPVYGEGAITHDRAEPARQGWKLDIAVQSLADKLVSEFPNTAFTRQHEVVLYPTEVPPADILLLGYPASIQPRRGFGAKQYTLGTSHCPHEAYETMGASPDTNLLVPFDKDFNRRRTGPSIAPDLYGMSGCGMWYVSRGSRPAVPRPRLAALAIEWHRKPLKCLWGTKLVAPMTYVLKDVGIRDWQ